MNRLNYSINFYTLLQIVYFAKIDITKIFSCLFNRKPRDYYIEDRNYELEKF